MQTLTDIDQNGAEFCASTKYRHLFNQYQSFVTYCKSLIIKKQNLDIYSSPNMRDRILKTTPINIACEIFSVVFDILPDLILFFVVRKLECPDVLYIVLNSTFDLGMQIMITPQKTRREFLCDPQHVM